MQWRKQREREEAGKVQQQQCSLPPGVLQMGMPPGLSLSAMECSVREELLPSLSERGLPHVTCDELWGGELSEEEAFALALQLSAQEDDERRAAAAVQASSAPAGRPRHVEVPAYDDDDFILEDDQVVDDARAAREDAASVSVRAWAEAQLESLRRDDTFESSALVDFVLGIDDDAELIDYLSAFVGTSEQVTCFAVELCERRRRVAA